MEQRSAKETIHSISRICVSLQSTFCMCFIETNKLKAARQLWHKREDNIHDWHVTRNTQYVIIDIDTSRALKIYKFHDKIINDFLWQCEMDSNVNVVCNNGQLKILLVSLFSFIADVLYIEKTGLIYLISFKDQQFLLIQKGLKEFESFRILAIG